MQAGIFHRSMRSPAGVNDANKMKKQTVISVLFLLMGASIWYGCSRRVTGPLAAVYPHRPAPAPLEMGFKDPPDDYRPGVYWYFMDGNLSKRSITKDLESMKKAGIGYVTFLEVNVGVPRGPVDFLSDAWQDIFVHTVREAERLGIRISLGTGPGWAGSGGPWVSAATSMQHLVHSDTLISGPGRRTIRLATPSPRKPFFGESSLSPELKKLRDEFYRDVAVLAWPVNSGARELQNPDEEALYYRAPYSSAKGVKPFFVPEAPTGKAGIPANGIIDLSQKLLANGTLDWDVPPGRWMVMRFGSRNNGAVTRPAPLPGLGFEADKFDTAALNAHLDHYIGNLLRRIGTLHRDSAGGLKMLHIDSWEMGAQNWTARFREEFQRRRRYDPLPYFPVYAGYTVGNPEITNRFLWDLRQTAQELVFDFHVLHTRQYAHKFGLGLSVEPYDMNPTADLAMGALADVTMCEFWNKAKGFNTNFSCIEAASVAHVNGQPLVPAEAFTSDAGTDGWQQHPATMKNQGDWAFAAGINRFVFHTFQNQYLDDGLRPGMTMGPYGVHWDRNQTWWPMVGAYHRYLSRCQFMLQQGRGVADILYLAAEDAPHVFLPPPSALQGDPLLPDRRSYNFDGCAPLQLYKASVQQGRIVFPGGASYRLLVLPLFETMTTRLLAKVHALIAAGAVVVGLPPKRTPGLLDFPRSDGQLRSEVRKIWGSGPVPAGIIDRPVGKGRVYWGHDLAKADSGTLYAAYPLTAAILKELQVPEDFSCEAPLRYTHRIVGDTDVYFIANTKPDSIVAVPRFRIENATPSLWNPVDGSIVAIKNFTQQGPQLEVPLHLAPYQSFFIVFSRGKPQTKPVQSGYPQQIPLLTLPGPWNVSFDTAWGGPARAVFSRLSDWSLDPDPGIRYYSGIVTYRQRFTVPFNPVKDGEKRLFLDLGDVKNMARIRLNGQDLGVVWTAPWQVDITTSLKAGENDLEIEVANLWTNRMIGDAALPDDGIKNNQWPGWLLQNQPRTSGRRTFTTYSYYKPTDPLLPSGLMGPVVIRQEQ